MCHVFLYGEACDKVVDFWKTRMLKFGEICYYVFEKIKMKQNLCKFKEAPRITGLTMLQD